MKRVNLANQGFTVLLCFVLVLIMPVSAAAHEDLDIGIISVSLDKQCRANIMLRNIGRNLPESFYETVTPAFVTINKGDQSEKSASLRALDKRRQLAKTGGELVLLSRAAFTHNPEPMQIDLETIGEFFDYGADNNQLMASMDCDLENGQKSGMPVKYTQPDVSVSELSIDETTCTVSAKFTNLTYVPMQEKAWALDGGVTIEQLNLDSYERVQSEPLIQLDKDMKFTRATQTLIWSAVLPPTTAARWRVGMWSVPEDRNFKNNQSEINVPSACRAKER